MRTGRLVPQKFLDRIADERPILDQLTALVGMITQDLAHPAEQAAGGIDAGTRDDHKEGQDLVLRQATHSS